MAPGQRPYAAHQRGLAAVHGRQQQRAALFPRRQHGRQHAMHGTQGAIQGQFSQHFESAKTLWGNLARGRQNAERDGEVVAASALGQVGWRQIDGHAPGGKFQAGIENGTAHALLALAHGGLGQAHDGEGGKAIGQVGFNGDQRRINADVGAGVDDSQ
jgi:hypothetical protein